MVCLGERSRDLPAHPLGQVIKHIALLVHLASLNHRTAAEHLAYGLGERLAPVDYHQK